MKTFMILVDLKLYVNEYHSSIKDVFICLVDAENEEYALNRANITAEKINHLSSFASEFDYTVRAVDVSNIDVLQG
jgi:hypothetical protein